MAFYATQPSTRTYVDTSQPLSGFGDDSLLAIYDGVAGLGASPSSCGCSGRRGRLAGLGDEILPPDDGLPVAASVNYMTAVTALLAAGSVVALGYFLLSPKAMRANGRKRKRRVALRRNAAKKRASGFYVTTYCNRAHSLKTGKPIGHECYTLPVAALRAEREGNYDLANEIMHQSRGMRRNGSHVRANVRGIKNARLHFEWFPSEAQSATRLRLPTAGLLRTAQRAAMKHGVEAWVSYGPPGVIGSENLGFIRKDGTFVPDR